MGPDSKQLEEEETRLLQALKPHIGKKYQIRRDAQSRTDSLNLDLKLEAAAPFIDDPLGSIYRLLAAGANPSSGLENQNKITTESILHTLLTAERLWKKGVLSENGLTATNNLT